MTLHKSQSIIIKHKEYHMNLNTLITSHEAPLHKWYHMIHTTHIAAHELHRIHHAT